MTINDPYAGYFKRDGYETSGLLQPVNEGTSDLNSAIQNCPYCRGWRVSHNASLGIGCDVKICRCQASSPGFFQTASPQVHIHIHYHTTQNPCLS